MSIDPKAIQLAAMSFSGRRLALDETIRSQEEPADKTLLELETTSEEESLPEIEIQDLLGEGGMGQVFVANQRSLARQVAVKTLKPQRMSPAAVGSLLREARRTGALEHPNIVPVHLLSQTKEGRPILVMKRVVGAPWRDMITNAAHPLWENFSGDRLVVHLELLKQVCNAVHFAHSRGILHRDIKPANVMIGQFGEVYLLDWGLAISLEEAKGGSKSLVGTLAYMAPEMVEGAAKVSVQTDVYLLGATLFEILTGLPPHKGETVLEVMSAKIAPVELDERVPAGLAEICKRAMHPDPAQRYGSALLLRQAISSFLQNRSLFELLEVSREKLSRFKVMAARQTSDAQEVYGLFGECRFGFEQARRLDALQEEARRLGEEALISLIEYELSQQNSRAAEGLLRSLSSPRPDLEARLAKLKSEKQRKEEAVERLKDIAFQSDTKVAGWQRNLVVLATFICYMAVASLLAIRERNGIPETAETLLYAQLFFFGAGLVVAIPTRKVFFQNEANRRIYFSAVFLVSIIMLAHVVGYIAQMSSKQIFMVDILLWAFFSGSVSIFLDRILLWSLAAHTIAAVVAAFFPFYASFLMGGALVVTGYTMIALWQRRGTLHGR